MSMSNNQLSPFYLEYQHSESSVIEKKSIIKSTFFHIHILSVLSYITSVNKTYFFSLKHNPKYGDISE